MLAQKDGQMQREEREECEKEGLKGGQDQRLSWRTLQEALNASENLQKQRQWVVDEDSAWSSACASASLALPVARPV